ncbi:MAG TPA: neutral zinc metallopeptidase [Actinomycetes bacterium]
MRFDEDSQLDTSQVQDTRGSRIPGGAPVAIGGGAGVLGLVIYLLVNLLGGSTGTLPGVDQVQVEGDNTQLQQECKTGQDANTKQDCRVVAVVNSVQGFWAQEFQRRGARYQEAPTRLFTNVTRTGCGTASSQTGPFYCPADGTVYIDLSFYGELQSRFGARGGPFAQGYVLAHEYGHHVQNLLGTTEQVARDRRTGPQSASVRLELQADCYAGLWANHATSTPGPDGDPLVAQLTEDAIADGLDAAAAIGDDRIQERFQGRVDRESWTHGSSEQRQRWFTTGYQTGDLERCDTFSGSV